MSEKKNLRTSRVKKSAPRRRRRKYKYDPMRLSIVIVAVLAIACSGIGLGYTLLRGKSPERESIAKVSSASSASSKKDDHAASLSVFKDEKQMTKLVALKENVDLVFQDNSLKDLKEQINAYLSEHGYDPAKVSWSVQDFVTGEVIESSNAKQNFTAASTYKLPLAVYYYEEIAAGRINPNDTLVYTEEMREKEDDENLNQPIHRKFKVGDKIQIDELLEAALLYSDNIAGHMLYENIGGYDKFKHIVAKYSDQPQTQEFFSESSNVVNADYMMRLLNHIYTTPGTFNDLKYWLQMTGINTFLNRNVPGTYIQKIGNLDEVRNAVGIYNGNPPFSLSIYSCISKTGGMDLLADLGQLCLTYFQNRYYSGFYDNYDMTLFQQLNNEMSSPLDVIALRPGPNGQTLPDLTEEEKKKMEAQERAELGDDASSEQSSSQASSETTQPAQDAAQTPADPNAQPANDPAQTPADPNAASTPDVVSDPAQPAAQSADPASSQNDPASAAPADPSQNPAG